MRAHDLVTKIERWNGKFCIVRYCIALNITVKHLREGLNSNHLGLHLFRGYWYGTDPFDIQSYGKIEGRIGKTVGRVRNHQQLVMLKRLGRFD